MLSRFDKELLKFKVYKFFITFFVYNPIMIIYFKKIILLSDTEIGIIVSSFFVGIFSSEIITGIIGDRIGWKHSVLIGSCLQAICIFFLGHFSTFLSLVITMYILAVASSFISGSDQSLFVALHTRDNRMDEIPKNNSKNYSSSLLGVLASSLLCSLLSSTNYQITFFVSSIASIVSFFVFSSIKITVDVEKQKTKKSSFFIFRRAVNEILTNKTLMMHIILSVIISSILMPTYFLFQPYMQSLSIPIKSFGAIYALFGIFPMISSRFIYKINKKIVLGAVSILLFTIYVLLSWNKSVYLCILLLCMFRLIWGAYIPTITSSIDNCIKNRDSNATILSINSNLISFFSAIQIFINGFLMEKLNINNIFAIYSFSMFILFGLFLIYYFRNKHIKSFVKNISI